MNAVQQAPQAPDRDHIVEIRQSANNYRMATPLRIPGQGTVSLRICAEKNFCISFAAENYTLGIEIDQRRISIFSQGADGQRKELRQLNAESPQQDFLNGGEFETYWVSLDKLMGRLRFGRGELHEKLCDLEFDYDECLGADDIEQMRSLSRLSLEGDFSSQQIRQARCRYRKKPLGRARAALVLPAQHIDLDALEQQSGIISSELSRECQLLYRHIQGASIRLNSPDFPDFAEAINHSIVTPGCLCHERLLHKTDCFKTSRKHQSYLRIGVGVSQGESPGAPFVLEIWPGQHYSPVHRHADCHAIIKVLHGSIRCMWYRSLSKDGCQPYGQTTLTQGQITWLDPDQYQTHRLYNHNVSGNMCATLQCYQYGSDDERHYEYFDYLNEESAGIEKFAPRTDWSYSEFRQKIRDEWSAYLNALDDDVQARLI